MISPQILNHTDAATTSGIPFSVIQTELQKMGAALPFRRSPRLAKFLRFTVEAALDGNGESLKEYSIGVQVFGKPADFDPRLDSIVRVEARRLRAAVDRFYKTDGVNSEIRIVYRAGSYVPTFRHRANGLSQHTDGSSGMMILVGSSEALNQIRADLESKIGLTPARVGANGQDVLSQAETARIMADQPAVPVFLIGGAAQNQI